MSDAEGGVLPTRALSELERGHVEFVRMAKVAVATAIIRSKPDSMTGGQYAAFLQQNFVKKIQSDRDEWEKRCGVLENELLRVKTKLLLNDAGTAESCTETQAEDIPSCSSTTPPSSSERASSKAQPEPFSQDDGTAESCTVTQAVDIPSCLSTTPPSSSERASSKAQPEESQKSPEEVLIRSHADFLTSVSKLRFTADYLDKVTACQLGKSSGCEDISDDWLKGNIVNEQTITSVDAILSVVQGIARDKKLTITLDTVHHCIYCIVQLLTSFESNIVSLKHRENPRLLEIATQIAEKCTLVSLELQAFIMQTTEMEKHEAQTVKCELVLSLANSPSLCKVILQQLIQGVVGIGKYLKASLSGNEERAPGIPPTYIIHENVCYLFKILEAILLNLLESGSDTQQADACGNQGVVDQMTQQNAPTTTDDPTQDASIVAHTPSSQQRPEPVSQDGLKATETVGPSQQPKSSQTVQKITKKQKTKHTSENIIEFFDSMKTPLPDHVTKVQPSQGQASVDESAGGTKTQECHDENDPNRLSQNHTHGVSSAISPEFVSYIQMAMEDALMYTCDDFPLFSYYVWKISDLAMIAGAIADF